jgi:M-phase inducer tyrosine phosphatase
MRNLDRKKHADSYPKLTFPDMFILEGGYKAFFETHKVRLYLRNLRWSNTLWLGFESL